MAAEQDRSEQVATQVAANTGTSGGSAGNQATTTAGAGPIASSTPVVGPKGFRLALQHMLQGWQELLPSDWTFSSSTGDLTRADVLAELQELLGVYADLDRYVTQAKLARKRVKSQRQQEQAYFAVLQSVVIAYFGAKSPELAKFGLQPKRDRTPLTSAQLAVRAAKVNATRALRGTKGSVQKAKIKSGPMQFVEPVAAPEVTPVVASTAPPGPTAAEN